MTHRGRLAGRIGSLAARLCLHAALGRHGRSGAASCAGNVILDPDADVEALLATAAQEARMRSNWRWKSRHRSIAAVMRRDRKSCASMSHTDFHGLACVKTSARTVRHCSRKSLSLTCDHRIYGRHFALRANSRPARISSFAATARDVWPSISASRPGSSVFPLCTWPDDCLFGHQHAALGSVEYAPLHRPGELRASLQQGSALLAIAARDREVYAALRADRVDRRTWPGLADESAVRGITIYRTIYYLPSVLAGVAFVVVWMWLLHPEAGLVNALLGLFGIQGPRWLTDPDTALYALWIMSIWGLGRTAIIFLAGLKDVPRNSMRPRAWMAPAFWGSFRNVTLPMITPTIFFNLVLSVIATFQTFTSAFVATDGGRSIPPSSSCSTSIAAPSSSFAWAMPRPWPGCSSSSSCC